MRLSYDEYIRFSLYCANPNFGLRGFVERPWNDLLPPDLYVSAEVSATRLCDMLPCQLPDETRTQRNGETEELLSPTGDRVGDSRAAASAWRRGTLLARKRDATPPSAVKASGRPSERKKKMWTASSMLCVACFEFLHVAAISIDSKSISSKEQKKQMQYIRNGSKARMLSVHLKTK